MTARECPRGERALWPAAFDMISILWQERSCIAYHASNTYALLTRKFTSEHKTIATLFAAR